MHGEVCGGVFVMVRVCVCGVCMVRVCVHLQEATCTRTHILYINTHHT